MKKIMLFLVLAISLSSFVQAGRYYEDFEGYAQTNIFTFNYSVPVSTHSWSSFPHKSIFNFTSEYKLGDYWFQKWCVSNPIDGYCGSSSDYIGINQSRPSEQCRYGICIWLDGYGGNAAGVSTINLTGISSTIAFTNLTFFANVSNLVNYGYAVRFYKRDTTAAVELSYTAVAACITDNTFDTAGKPVDAFNGEPFRFQNISLCLDASSYYNSITGVFSINRTQLLVLMNQNTTKYGIDDIGYMEFKGGSNGQIDNIDFYYNDISTQCDDGSDNDGDGYTDYPADFGCSSPSDDTESTQCNNSIDDDSDSYIDYPADTGCADLLDDNETNAYVPPAPTNYAPNFIQVNSTYGLINSIGDPNGGFHASANDTEGDTLAWGIDCNYQDWHESPSEDASTSVYIARKILSESISCTDFIDSEHAKRFKLYLYDDDHKGWGNFSTLNGAYDDTHGAVDWIPFKDILPMGTYEDEYLYIGANVIEGTFLWTNRTPMEYVTVRVRKQENLETLNYVKVIITNYSTIDSPAGTDGMWEITGEHGMGGYWGSYRMGSHNGMAYFDLPNGTYQLTAVDVAEVPMYANKTVTCHTYPTKTTFCDIAMDFVGESNVTGNQLSFLVRDSITYSPIENVNVSIISPQPQWKLTTSSGIVNFINLSYSTYEVMFRKSGYTTKQGYWLTSGEGYAVSLVPSNVSQTLISMTVKDENQAPIKDVFVEMGNPITYETYYAFTGTDGTVIQPVLDGDYNWNFHLTLDGYADKDYTRFINRDMNNEFTLFMSQSGAGGFNYSSGQCQDMVKGVWLCNQSNLKCTVDNDCLGGRCDPAHYCSAFNWTWCDAHGRPRNQRCIMVATGNRSIEKLADWMLSNFFYVLVIVIVLFLIALVLVMLRGRHK